jgi:excisionase family DNA binding protein
MDWTVEGELIAMSSSTRATSSEPFVTREDVAAYIAVSLSTVDRMVRRGVIPAYRPLGPGGPLRFRIGDCEKAMRRAMTTGPVRVATRRGAE